MQAAANDNQIRCRLSQFSVDSCAHWSSSANPQSAVDITIKCMAYCVNIFVAGSWQHHLPFKLVASCQCFHPCTHIFPLSGCHFCMPSLHERSKCALSISKCIHFSCHIHPHGGRKCEKRSATCVKCKFCSQPPPPPPLNTRCGFSTKMCKDILLAPFLPVF